MAGIFSHCMLASNVASVLYLTLLEFQMEQGYQDDGRAAVDTETARRRLISKIKTAFEKYPSKYVVRIGLPSFTGPKEAMRIDITPDMHLELSAGALRASGSVLVLSGSGYLDSNFNSPLAFQMLSQAKLFAFFMRSLDFALEKSYSVLATAELKDLKAADDSPQKVTIPTSLSRCFGGLAIHHGSLVKRRGEGNLRLSVMFDNLRDWMPRLQALLGLAKSDEGIAAAIEWYEDSRFAENETLAFLQVCIGFEALLQDPSQRLDDMTNRLCDRLAFSLGRSRAERKVIGAEYRAILDLRGQLVHSKQPRIRDSERKHLETARALLKRLVDAELQLMATDD
jgi:hypothetical protein